MTTMDRRSRSIAVLRNLRIAWSAAGAIFALLLFALWVRSYNSEDRVSGHVSTVGVRLYSSRGWIVSFKNNAIPPGQYPWSIELGSDHWLGPNDARLRISSPAPFFGPAATSHLSIPHPTVIAIVFLLAGLPWLPWRFSLRTLLITSTVVAVALGLAVMMLRTN
jgi:hypothetical protein